MEKMARKPSTDPVQEKLRQNKATWNKEVSTFVNDLIHFKKMMNGWPSKFYQEKSSIKEPIPADPATIIGSLAGDFQELAQKGNTIIEEQLTYSQGRRKRQPKQLNLPFGQPEAPKSPSTPEPPKPDLSQQLSLPSVASREDDLIKVGASFENKYYLESEGSNPLTRFFAKVTNPGFGFGQAASRRRARMTWLKSCAKTFKLLENLQVMIVKKSNESIHKSNELTTQIWNQWSTVSRGYADLKKKEVSDNSPQKSDQDSPLKDNYDSSERDSLPNTTVSDTKSVDQNSEITIIQAKSIESDYKNVINSAFIDANSLSSLAPIIDAFIMSKPENKLSAAQNLIKEYQALLSNLHKISGISAKSLTDYATQNSERSAVKTASDQLEVTAQAFLKKWLGKKRHQLSMFDDTSNSRLQVFDLSEEMRTLLDKIMNLLEKGLDFNSLTPLINEMNSKTTALRGMVRSLHNTTTLHKAK